MGVASVFLGYIKQAWPGIAGDAEEKQRKLAADATIWEQTDRMLESLPHKDNWPPLCRPMFSSPPRQAELISYENRLVHFAASIKNVDFELRDWFDKFEALLKQLYWEEAYVRIDAGYIGTHEFRWLPKQEWLGNLYRGLLTPITDWNFVTTLEKIE